MCISSIELVLVEKYGKREEKHHLWAFPRSGTGTKQCGTGTILILLDWYRYHIDSFRLVPVPKIRYRYPMLYFGLAFVFWP